MSRRLRTNSLTLPATICSGVGGAVGLLRCETQRGRSGLETLDGSVAPILSLGFSVETVASRCGLRSSPIRISNAHTKVMTHSSHRKCVAERSSKAGFCSMLFFIAGHLPIHL